MRDIQRSSPPDGTGTNTGIAYCDEENSILGILQIWLFQEAGGADHDLLARLLHWHYSFVKSGYDEAIQHSLVRDWRVRILLVVFIVKNVKIS